MEIHIVPLLDTVNRFSYYQQFRQQANAFTQRLTKAFFTIGLISIQHGAISSVVSHGMTPISTPLYNTRLASDYLAPTNREPKQQQHFWT